MTHLTDLWRERGVGRLLPRLVIIGAVAMFAIGTAWELLSERHTIAQSTANANLAAIAGPPCPAVSAAGFQSALKAQDLTLKYVFDFNGDTFGRAIGDGDCDVAAAKGSGGFGSYDVCQFTGPAVLYVKTGRGEFFFLPGLGHKATVMTEGGSARCVMAAPNLDY
ncbi:MAG TPA: hypothetical protein VN694_15225 [Caulobacteraceae bacterium]|nr:hypothetical protein [Caulobacteraceae bacterium]